MLWLVSEFVVLWLSRTRELAADHWSCECTGNGDALVSALVKVGYGMTVKQHAAATRTSDPEPARQGVGPTVRHLGMFDQGAAGSMVNGFVGGLDVQRAVAALRWECLNPWAHVLEKGSTHPLVGRRIAVLQRSGLPGAPTWLGLDAATIDDDPATAS